MLFACGLPVRNGSQPSVVSRRRCVFTPSSGRGSRSCRCVSSTPSPVTSTPQRARCPTVSGHALTASSTSTCACAQCWPSLAVRARHAPSTPSRTSPPCTAHKGAPPPPPRTMTLCTSTHCWRSSLSSRGAPASRRLAAPSSASCFTSASRHAGCAAL